MIELLTDALIDTIKLTPYLFVTFLILELVEHKLSKKNEKILSKNRKYGPIIGGILGAFPQCGFSTMASNLFSSGIITTGTLIAVFLSTSDEMLPILLSEKVNPVTIIKIVCFKVIIGIIMGLIVDLFYKRKKYQHVNDICEKEHCHCDHDGLLLSSIKHTLKIIIFILIANITINLIIYFIGEDALKKLLLNKNIFTYFIASLFGLIPNCASSIIITELYISNLITKGIMLSGLLTGSGLGILVLFKENDNNKENILILIIIFVIGVVTGIIVDLI